MNKPVLIVIVVLVAVVVLFAVGVGAGVRGDQGSASEQGDSALLDRLGALAGAAADADLADITADCEGLGDTPPVLTFTGSCDLTVARSDERIRLVRLRSAQPLTITAPAPEGDLDDIESDVDPGEEVKIAVGPDGAGDPRAEDEKDEIEIDCPGLNTTCNVLVLNAP